MLTPNELQSLPDALSKTYERVEDDILADIARRITKAGYATDTAGWQAEKARELKTARTDILRRLSRDTGRSERELTRMFDEAGVTALSHDDEIYREAGFSPPPLAESKALRDTLSAGLRNTRGELRNLTRTTANTATKQFEDALDEAYMRVVSGAFSPAESIRRAVKQLGAEGLQSIRYPSGHTDHMDVAVRRAALTGVNQTVGQLQLTRADEMGCDLVQTTSHMGARPTHAVWQGRIFSRSGKHPRYPPFEASTGYGTGPGLCGWNCHHSFYPFFEGLSADTYTRYDTEENRKAYEQSQQQRAYERAIRQSKRELSTLDSAVKAAPDDATRAALETEFSRSAAKLRRQRDRLEDFLAETGRTRRADREQVVGFGRSQSAKAVQAFRKTLLPNFGDADIPKEKLAAYVLNPNHPVGRDKALVFERVLGYTESNWEDLERRIRDGLRRFPATKRRETQFGTPFEVVMEITGPVGRTAKVKTGWLIDRGSKIPRLISAYIDEE